MDPEDGVELMANPVTLAGLTALVVLGAWAMGRLQGAGTKRRERVLATPAPEALQLGPVSKDAARVCRHIGVIGRPFCPAPCIVREACCGGHRCAAPPMLSAAPALRAEGVNPRRERQS